MLPGITEELLIRISTGWRLLYGGLGASIVALVLAASLSRTPPETIGLVTLGVFGSLALTIAILPKRLQERYQLTPKGLEGRAFRGRSIPWQAIKRVEVRRSLLEPYLCLWLAEPEAYSGMGDGHRLWWVRHRPAKFGDVAVNFVLLSPSATTIAQEIRRRTATSIASAV